MAINFHGERAAVNVSKPARNRRNVNARFNATGGEQMPQIVMRDAGTPDILQARVSDFSHSPSTQTRSSRLWLLFTLQPFKQFAHGRE